jgi:predicted ArsR family transcriptional regulator
MIWWHDNDLDGLPHDQHAPLSLICQVNTVIIAVNAASQYIGSHWDSGDYMDAAALGRRFLETTRGQIVALLRRGARTVEELARALGLTNNAVRNHLSVLERDGLIRQEGVRRGAGAGKPAVVYELDPVAAPLFSRAYPPALSSVMDALVEGLPPEQATELLREVGRRLARRAGGRATGDFDARVRAAAGVLDAFGGDVEVRKNEREQRIEGSGCPLSSVVCHRPEVCGAIETLLAEVAGAPVKSCCEHGTHPRCCFVVSSGPDRV